MNLKRRILCAISVALLCAGNVNAQSTYPNKPIRIIIPYLPGSGADNLLRLLGESMQKSMGQPVILVYRPGSSTILGSELVARAAPDGYTFGLITDSHSLNPLFNKKLPYDSLRDFQPVTQLVDSPLVLLTRPSLPVKNVRELIAYAKSNPGKLAYGSPGFGTPHYIAMEWFKHSAGIDILHVPYKGSPEMFSAIIGGDIQVMLIGAVTALPYAKDGRVNLIASAPGTRLELTPNVPTIAESGIKDFAVMSWYGLVAPANTPKDIVTRINREVRLALDAPEMKQRIAAFGLVPATSTPEEFAVKLKKDAEHYARIVSLTGARGE